MKSLSGVWHAHRLDCAGNTAVEFALILPIFLMVVFGGFYLALLTFTASSLHYAVEAGARCASINTTTCADSAATIAYTRTKFGSAGGNVASFATSSAACGHVVTGQLTYRISTGVAQINVPLSAQACYP